MATVLKVPVATTEQRLRRTRDGGNEERLPANLTVVTVSDPVFYGDTASVAASFRSGSEPGKEPYMSASPNHSSGLVVRLIKDGDHWRVARTTSIRN